MAIKIIPYCEVDGCRTFRDAEIMEIYDRIEADGKTNRVFSDGSIDSREGFLRSMKHGDNMLFVIIEDDQVVGITWLNRFRYRTAHCHFCFLCPWSKAVVAGKQVLATLMGRRDSTGRYLYDLFQGVIPVKNKTAITFARAVGGKSLGLLPCAVWNRDAVSEDAEFIYFTR